MILHLRLVLCILLAVAVALLVTVTAVIVLTASKQQANNFEEASKENTDSVNKAGLQAVVDAVEIVQKRTNAVIAGSVQEYLSVGYIPVDIVHRRVAAGELGLSGPLEVDYFRAAHWVIIKAIPELRWLYFTTFPNGEWIAYERVIMLGDACTLYQPPKGSSAHRDVLCRDEEMYNLMIHDECCAPTMPGSRRYHYFPVDTETGIGVGTGIEDEFGVPRYDWAAHEHFDGDPHGCGGPEADGDDNGTFCCGYQAVHVDIDRDPIPSEHDQAWQQPFMWTGANSPVPQYLISWNKATFTPSGRFLGVSSVDFSLNYLGAYLNSLRRPQFQSEDFFLLDARSGGRLDDELLIASSCQRTGDSVAENRCGLSWRTNNSDPSAGWGPAERTGVYIGGADPDGDTQWDPLPIWRVADIQGGLLRALQLMAWAEFPTGPDVPKWDTSRCGSWCGASSRDRSWSEVYRRYPPHPDGPHATNGWSGTFVFQDARYFVTVSALILGNDRVRREGRPEPDGTGVLRWVVISVVQSTEYTRGIMQATADAEANMHRQTEATAQELDDARNLTIIIVVFVGLGFITFTFAMVFVTTLPLRHLAAEMQSAADMDLDYLGGPERSMFAEVRELQCSFSVMVQSLRELRNYMPHHALAQVISVSGPADDPVMPSPHLRVGLCGRSSASSGSLEAEVVSPCGSPAGRSSTSGSRWGYPPTQRSVTLLARNCTGFLSHPQLGDTTAFTAVMADEVERFTSIVQAQGGVADMLAGDHYTASFGALRVQGTQKRNAVVAAVQLSASPTERRETFGWTRPQSSRSLNSLFPGGRLPAPLKVTTAVCGGRVLCGDFGSAGVQRYMLIGGVSSFLPVVERAAAAWGTNVLIDTVVHVDAEQHWHCRLRKHLYFPKLSPQNIGIWEVVNPRLFSPHASEWMYELENAESNPWRRYNEAVSLWCIGGDPQSAIQTGLGERPGSPVHGALLALQSSIQDGARPPLCQITVAAGEPAPVSAPAK
eukprot:TRINITY_DN5551_c2_g1_i1.p1 TRINITY_DN5551_c2_g1~~TRINITY_DN5551_c2_g1_i1.p1  ORF type:complete len:998 (+),score=141.82 TRINITY_DN5551_c2_g1_i1:90-3083(+)